jgi:hypothetical protein
MNQDFVAIKLGDVNNSWTPPTTARTAGDAPPVEFMLPNVTAKPGDTIKAGIMVSAFKQVTSVQFTLQWNPDFVEFVGFGDFALPSITSDNFGTGAIGAGKLTFSWDDPQLSGVTVADGTAIFTASFRVLETASGVSSLAFIDSPTPREVTVNATLGNFSSQNGTITAGVVTVPRPVISGGLDATKTAFHVSFSTMSGVAYVVEYSDVLPAANWTTLSNVSGDGTVKLVTDPTVNNHQRFYRVRTQ